ncbi:hypothetical protein DER45DRAFT_595281 [Fusarium avenaceum]|nr:hypothetical protein DER45DRAFT_595281 [Fusarium avenaceum]
MPVIKPRPTCHVSNIPQSENASLNQTAAVNWFLLKTKKSYHDNIEHLTSGLPRYPFSVVSRSGLPMSYWRYACEIIKFLWYQPFNRYAWIVERDWSKNEVAYHSEHIEIIRHVSGLGQGVCGEGFMNIGAQRAGFLTAFGAGFRGSRKISLKQDEKSVRSSRLTETLPAAPKTDIFSPRVDTVTSLITMIRKTALNEKCLVVLSSVMFLDIVDEALRRISKEH